MTAQAGLNVAELTGRATGAGMPGGRQGDVAKGFAGVGPNDATRLDHMTGCLVDCTAIGCAYDVGGPASRGKGTYPFATVAVSLQFATFLNAQPISMLPVHGCVPYIQLVLGGRWVEAQGDVGLARAAESALGKIAATSQKELREKIAEIRLWAPRPKRPAQTSPNLGLIREAIRLEHKIQMRYRDAGAAATERVIWPIALGFFENARVVAAWCELRVDFRHFRVDRMDALQALDTRYAQPRREPVRAWRKQHVAASRS